MRLSASEKYEIIQTVTRSELSVKKTLQEFGIAKSTFYKRPPQRWYSSYLDHGYDGLLSKEKVSNRKWNAIPQQ
jgi:putative transposase